MVDGNGDDERKTKYFILSIFICVFAGSFQETVLKIWFVSNIFVKNSKSNESRRIFGFIESFDPPKYLIYRIGRFFESVDLPIFLVHRILKTEKSMVITSLV